MKETAAVTMGLDDPLSTSLLLGNSNDPTPAKNAATGERVLSNPQKNSSHPPP